MTRLQTCRIAGLLCLVTVFSIAQQAMTSEPSDATAMPTGDQGVQDLVYLAPSAPIFVRLRITIDGEGLQAQRAAYADELFDELDTNSDGMLNDAEIESIPPAEHLVPVSGSISTSTVGQIVAADADGDGQVTQAEFLAYMLRASGALCHVNTEVQQPSNGQPVQLFDRLDRDGDGQLSSVEIAGAAHALRLMDFDLDERLRDDEIRMPTVFGVRQDNNPLTSQAAASMSLLEPINRHFVDEALIRKLIQKYDKLGRSAKSRRFSKDRHLSADEFGQSAEAVAEFDENQDNLLDQQELRKYLSSPQPHYELVIDFGNRSTEPTAEVISHREMSQPAVLEISASENGSILFQFGATRFELDVDQKIRPVLARGFFNAFDSMDRDGNEYLDRNEFRQRAGLEPDHFALVDLDGDEMIIEEEFRSFAQQQAELQKHIVSLSLAGSDQALFAFVDTSADRRLDASELAEIESRLLELDRDHDGNLKKQELSEDLRMIITRGNVNLAESGNVFDGAADAMLTLQQQRAVSGWFNKMDRNRDGQVTKREFLGPMETFFELDINKNGLIDRSESQ